MSITVYHKDGTKTETKGSSTKAFWVKQKREESQAESVKKACYAIENSKEGWKMKGYSKSQIKKVWGI